MLKRRRWYDYLWIASAIYLALGFLNILFAWLGLICFIMPLLIAIIKGNKTYCNRCCGRGQLFELLGGRLGFSQNKAPPKFLRSNWFRYGFLAFFMTMFGMMVYATYAVFAGAPLAAPWMAQFAFGFYGVMLTSTLLGLLTMLLFKPHSWCVYCPMGTMTQGICQIKHRKEFSNGTQSKANC